MGKYNFSVRKTLGVSEKPDSGHLGFGNYFTDHMFAMEYGDGAWHDGRIEPYAPIVIDPAAAVFHYAQTIFEGLKAYLTESGSIKLFRPFENARRANRSAGRLCIPEIDEDLYVEAIKALIRVDRDWIPSREGTSLYIRPFTVATEAFLGVRPSKRYAFYVIMSPVGSYYAEGLKPTKIYVENEYARTVKGGTGAAKTGGNYAAGLLSQEIAKKKGCAQVLWLDGVHRKYVEEIGTSNAFFVIDGTVFTSPLTGTVLEGITRKSVIELLKHWDIPVAEERFTIEDVFDAWKEGRLSEVFATGTAAVISPVGEILWKNENMIVRDNMTGPIAKRLYDEITGIQSGKSDDIFGWTVFVE